MHLNTLIAPIVTLVSACFLIGLFARKADDPREVVSWARAYRVTITSANRPSIVWFVRASITLRVLGAVSGLILGSFFDHALVLRTSTGFGFWVWILLGWVAGALWAESRVLPRSVAPAASLVPRRVGDYLPAGLRWAPAAAAVLVSSVALFGTIAGPPTPPQLPVAPAADLWLAVLGSALLAATATVAERRVVAHRQPVASLDLTAVDDAVRASTVHLVAAATTAAILLIGAHASQNALLPRGLGGPVTVVFVLGALFCSRYFAYRAWRVRRPIERADTVVTA